MSTFEPNEALTSYPDPAAAPDDGISGNDSAGALTQSDLDQIEAVDTSTGAQAGAENVAAVHTFQVTHKIASPDNAHAHSIFTSAELTVDEAIAWIRQRLLES